MSERTNPEKERKKTALEATPAPASGGGAPARPPSGDAAASEGEAEELPEAEEAEEAEAAEAEEELAPLARPARPRPPVHPAAERLPAGGEPQEVEEAVEVSAMSDEDLMKLCQDGDELAFEALFQRYEGPALSFIHRMIGDRSRTEALGQEAFLRIFKDAKSYQYPRSFSTWFYTIVRNLCKNELRWRSRHPTVSIEENLDRSDGSGEGPHIGDNLRSETIDPLDHMLGEELQKKLEDALNELPELERDILILNRFQGLKYREIADVVGVPVGTVRSRIHGALDRLRKSVKEYL